MSLRITKGSDPIEVKQITVCLCAQPGLGRTSTAFTTNTLLLDFDKGAYRSKFRKDTVQIENWGDVAAITPEDMAPYDTIAVDTVGRALDVLTAALARENAKWSNGAGSLTLPGWGILKGRFAAWLKGIHAIGKDVILCSHLDESRKGDDVLERLDIQGSSKNEVYKQADAMARLYMQGGQRILNFTPGDFTFGKDPAMLGALKVPDFNQSPTFLAEVIATIKHRLNDQTAEMAREQSRMDLIREGFEKLADVDQFNIRAGELAESPPKIKALLVAVAQSKGFKLDKTSRPARFVASDPSPGVPATAGADRPEEAGAFQERIL